MSQRESQSRLSALSAGGLLASILSALSLPALAQELDYRQVFELQFRLNQLGFESGRVDGEVGGRTRAAVYRFADAHDTRADLTPVFLAQVRAAARTIEGLPGEDGAIDFLVFTDEGTPLILRVNRIGRLDGPVPVEDPTPASEADATPVAASAVLDLPREQGVAFGVEVEIPTPPEGERLTVDQIVSEPERLADGTIRFTEHVSRHTIRTEPVNPQAWVWRFATLPDSDQTLGWRFTLENAGNILLTRTFRLRVAD
jgi:peptidoglycan hydrolase-like protein with peptidoglycan-binding domain